MTAPGLRVDIAGLRQSVPAFVDLADDVDAALGRLDAALAAEGPCWGSDETGVAFGGSYRPAVEQVRTAFGAVARGCAETAAGLTAVADSAAASDGRAGRRLGG